MRVVKKKIDNSCCTCIQSTKYNIIIRHYNGVMPLLQDGKNDRRENPLWRWSHSQFTYYYSRFIILFFLKKSINCLERVHIFYGSKLGCRREKW